MNLVWNIQQTKQDFIDKCNKFDPTLINGWDMCIDHIEQQGLWSTYQLAVTDDSLEVPAFVSIADEHFVGLMNTYGIIQFNIFHRDGLMWAANDVDSCFYLLDMLEGR